MAGIEPMAFRTTQACCRSSFRLSHEFSVKTTLQSFLINRSTSQWREMTGVWLRTDVIDGLIRHRWTDTYRAVVSRHRRLRKSPYGVLPERTQRHATLHLFALLIVVLRFRRFSTFFLRP